MKTLAAFLLIAGAANAQVERTEAQSVLVDVLVTDKKGAYVPGLTERDFQVWEDGKEQMVDGLFTEKGSATQVKPSLLLLFDNAALTLREQAMARQIALRILDQSVASAPNVAVLDFIGALRISQTFTADITRAKQAVAQPKGSALSADNGGPTDVMVRDFFQALDGLVKNLQNAPGRKSVVFFTPGYTMNSLLDERLKQVVGAANQSNVSFYPINMRVTSAFGGGQLTDVSAPAAGAAGGRGGRVAINPRAGMNTSEPAINADAPPAGPALLGALTDLASSTGGFVVRQPDDLVGLAKITQEQSEFYVLSYTPPESASGSCHKLRVKVKRDGLNLRSREGYCKRTIGDVLSGSSASRALEQRAAAKASGNIPATMQAPYFYKSANVARVAAVLAIDPANIAFKKEKNAFLGQMDILGIANKSDGSTGARFSDVVKFEFDSQAKVDQFKRTPYRYENQFDIVPGEYKLSVVLGGGGESFGRLQTDLEIEPYDGSEFSLSGIALSKVFYQATPAGTGLDEFLIDDRKKLVAEGVELAASATSKFAAKGPAAFFVEIYEPLLKTPNPEFAVGIQVRVLDGAGGELRADTGMKRLDLSRQSGTTIPLAMNPPITDLTPGNYVLELQAFDSAGKTAKRTVPFEIE